MVYFFIWNLFNFIHKNILILEKTALIQMFTDDDWKNTVYVKATYKPHEEQKTEEKSIYFMPNSTITPLNVKLANDRQNPRYLEKEGFYVGVKPFVPRKNRNLMEDRLVHMPDKVYFLFKFMFRTKLN